ncbi:MAG: T9SS type A sorting domain-containing protein, partial [Bacteroidales bacterium]
TVLPGTQTITLTLDADAVAPGVYDAEVIITDDDGIFLESVMVHFEITDQMGQKIMIPEPGQWGYISTFIDMDAKMSMDEVMTDIADDMVIMLGKTGIFWPEFSINTIGEYDTYQGYKLKMANDAALAFYGQPVDNKILSFTAGTHIVPVFSEEPILAATVFEGQPVEFAFGLDGTIYWPGGDIYTLELLEPGYGYLVRFSAPATLDFSGTKAGSMAFNKPASRVNYTTWNDVNYTGDVHIIGISSKAVSELLPGDVVGVFCADGQCTGMALYSGDNNAFALTAYADDPTTDALDGMLEGETLQIKIFRDNETIDAQPVYSKNMPDHSGSYVINGLTMIDSFKAGPTSIGDAETASFAVYPNPTTGIITIDGISSTTRVMVTNTQGQIISNISIETAHQLDLSAQPSGLYFVKLMSDQGTKIVKLIVR